MARKVHDPETKASAMAALLSGQGVNAVSLQYNLPESTVSRWKAEARKEAGRSDNVGELLLQYLHSGLETVTAQHAVFRDPKWLRAQDASAVAVLHGVLLDKLIRLLEALEGSAIQPPALHTDGRNRVRQHV